MNLQMTRYCAKNVVCLDEGCKKPHYKTFAERIKLSDLYLEVKDAMETHKEPLKTGRATCRYHFLCFERECPYNHDGIALDGRKFLIKALKTSNNREKAKTKIDKDIEDIRNGKTMDWADM